VRSLFRLSWFGLLLAATTPAYASSLVVLVDTGTDMPMAQFARGKLVDGMHKDIGEALGAQLKRNPTFLGLPRKRIALALENGQADILCSYMQEWLPGAFDWSQGFIPIVELLISDRKSEQPMSIEDLAGQPIGTVLGFSHPEMEAILGPRFIREDAQNSEANLRKLAVGRVQYAVTGKAYLDYRLKQGDLALSLHPPIVVKTYMGQCAVSRKGHVKLAEVDAAIAQLLKDGSIARILRRYQ
jgi:polar amino acid transport system substrate-binding protein